MGRVFTLARALTFARAAVTRATVWACFRPIGVRADGGPGVRGFFAGFP